MKQHRTIITLFCTIILCSCSTALPKDGESNDKNLAKYFGFGQMETLKLQWGISPPVIADVNNDKLNDIIVINNRKARIELLLQKKNFKPDQNISIEIEDDDVPF